MEQENNYIFASGFVGAKLPQLGSHVETGWHSSGAGMLLPSASWEREKAFCLGLGTHFVLPWSLLADMSWQFFPKPAFTCPSPACPSRLLLV